MSPLFVATGSPLGKDRVSSASQVVSGNVVIVMSPLLSTRSSQPPSNQLSGQSSVQLSIYPPSLQSTQSSSQSSSVPSSQPTIPLLSQPSGEPFVQHSSEPLSNPSSQSSSQPSSNVASQLTIQSLSQPSGLPFDGSRQYTGGESVVKDSYGTIVSPLFFVTGFHLGKDRISSASQAVSGNFVTIMSPLLSTQGVPLVKINNSLPPDSFEVFVRIEWLMYTVVMIVSKERRVGEVVNEIMKIEKNHGMDGVLWMQGGRCLDNRRALAEYNIGMGESLVFRSSGLHGGGLQEGCRYLLQETKEAPQREVTFVGISKGKYIVEETDGVVFAVKETQLKKPKVKVQTDGGGPTRTTEREPAREWSLVPTRVLREPFLSPKDLDQLFTLQYPDEEARTRPTRKKFDAMMNEHRGLSPEAWAAMKVDLTKKEVIDQYHRHFYSKVEKPIPKRVLEVHPPTTCGTTQPNMIKELLCPERARSRSRERDNRVTETEPPRHQSRKPSQEGRYRPVHREYHNDRGRQVLTSGVGESREECQHNQPSPSWQQKPKGGYPVQSLQQSQFPVQRPQQSWGDQFQFSSNNSGDRACPATRKTEQGKTSPVRPPAKFSRQEKDLVRESSKRIVLFPTTQLHPECW